MSVEKVEEQLKRLALVLFADTAEVLAGHALFDFVIVREELKAGLTARTRLKIQKGEVGHIDFLRDTALLKVYYESASREVNTADHITPLPREDERI